jgi:hypothetical protein
MPTVMQYRQGMVDACGGAGGPGSYSLSEVTNFFGNNCPVTYLRLRSNGS